MCAIEEVRSYRYAGKHYDTELEAVTAALTEIGTRIIRDHHHNPVEGLLKYGNDIGELRARYGTLSLPANAVEVTSELMSGEPKRKTFKGHSRACRSRAFNDLSRCSCSFGVRRTAQEAFG